MGPNTALEKFTKSLCTSAWVYKCTNGAPLMLDKETVSKMGLYNIKNSRIDVEENLLICIDRAEGLIDEEHPLYECFSKVKDIAE